MLTDEFIAERKKQNGACDSTEDESVQPAPVNDSKPAYWVFHQVTKHTAKVHHAHCCNCRNGQGKTDGASKSGEWLPFHSEESAMEAARQLQPDRHSICNMCLGSPRTLGYKHKGSSRQLPP